MLNAEQQQFVTDNYGLVKSFLCSRNLSFDEWEDVAAIGLCKAVEAFDPSKGAFSTLAYAVMFYEIHHNTRKPRVATVSINTPVTEFATIQDTLQANFSISDIDAQTSFDTLLQEFTPVERKAINLYLGGFKQVEIGNNLGKTQVSISRLINKFRNKYLVQKKTSC